MRSTGVSPSQRMSPRSGGKSDRRVWVLDKPIGPFDQFRIEPTGNIPVPSSEPFVDEPPCRCFILWREIIEWTYSPPSWPSGIALAHASDPSPAKIAAGILLATILTCGFWRDGTGTNLSGFAVVQGAFRISASKYLTVVATGPCN